MTLPKKKAFEFLEHTADVYIAAYGSTLKEAFGNAALAMFEVMTDTKTVKTRFMDDLKAEGEDEGGLLYSWLECLLIKFDVDGNLYSKFNVEKIERGSGGYFLEGKAWGEPYDPERHPSRTEVKAITYHRMEILKGKNNVTVKFILDI